MKKQMIQQVVTAPGQVELISVDMPKPETGKVLVEIKRVGICGSDIHVWHGKHPYVTYPLTQGHEVSGVIAEVGPEVKSLSVGQKVTIEPQIFCGQCYPCLHGKYNLCESLRVMGFQAPGAASEYFLVEAAKITPLPETMSFEEGAMLEPLAVTVHACKRTGDIEGLHAVVMGAGPIGNLLCQTLKAFGAKKVLVTDVSDYRLALAKDCGADFIANTEKTDFAKILQEVFGKDKADIIYDCAGNDITMNQAIFHGRKGSRIMLIAVYGQLAKVDLAKLNDSEIDLLTSMMYRHEDYVEAIRIVSQGKVQLAPLVSSHFALDEYEKAYGYIDKNREKTMKVMIDVDRIAKNK